MAEQFECKGRMFFGQAGGQPKKNPLADFESSTGPKSGYYTTAPASLPGGPDKPCILECDSPNYPPTIDEYRQCGCRMCLKFLARETS